MEKFETNRKLCLERQTELRRLLTIERNFDEGIQMFFSQHAALHTAEMAGPGAWSFEDAVLGDMTERAIRRIPHNCEHSVAWCIWHIARIEDIAMNLLAGGTPQVFSQDNWPERMNVKFRDAGNAMDEAGMAALSDSIHVGELRAYRVAVGRQTREIVAQLKVDDLKEKVDLIRIQRVMDEGALTEDARGIADYWSKRNIAGLLLMPATRHHITHLNEALRLKQRRQ